jgi:putative transposase
VIVKLAVKVRVYPNSAQEALLAKTLGCKRWIWNYWREERETYYHEHGNTTGFKYTSAKVLKETRPWLKEPDSIALQQARIDLETAYKNYFDGVKGKRPKMGYPKFKSKHGKQSYRTVETNGNIKIDFVNRKLKLPKVGWIKYRDDRVFDEKIKNVTVTRTKDGRYFASLQIDREIDIQERTTIQENKIAAFDMSCTAFMVGTGEDRFDNPRFYRNHENKLKKLHRQVSRKKKGSKNRNKARAKLARFYGKIGNRRNDWQQKLSTTLVKENEAIIIEDLNIEGMKRFNGGIAKSVTLDFSWGEFTCMLEYKCTWHGKHLVKVDRFYPSSKLCSNCGFKHDALKLSDREWTCPGCGTQHDRDGNSANNLNVEGKRILREERNITIIESSTAGTAGSHASGDRVRRVNKTAVVDEGRIHVL